MGGRLVLAAIAVPLAVKGLRRISQQMHAHQGSRYSGSRYGHAAYSGSRW
jgi:hypothetical protein